MYLTASGIQEERAAFLRFDPSVRYRRMNLFDFDIDLAALVLLLFPFGQSDLAV